MSPHDTTPPASAQPVNGAPIRLLWQVRNALAHAGAICDAVPNREPGHLGKLVNAQTDGSHGYRQIHDALEALDEYLTTPEEAQPVQVVTEETASAYLEKKLWEFIDMAAFFPKANPDPRTWATAMIYAPRSTAQAGEFPDEFTEFAKWALDNPYGGPKEAWQARAALSATQPAQAAQVEPEGWTSVRVPTQWTPGPNVFKDWCAQWFGPDSDDDHLMRAVHALLGTTQPAPAQGAGEVVAEYAKSAALDALIAAAPLLYRAGHNAESAECNKAVLFLTGHAAPAGAPTQPAAGADVLDATEEMLIAGLKECEPLGELIDWQEGFGRNEMRAVWNAMRAAIAASGRQE